MNPKETSRILDSVSADFIPADANLLPGIEAHFETRARVQPRRIRPALAVALILLALILLTGVVYALAQNLGFIPGVGLVDLEHGVRILKSPVSGGNGQITVKVKRMVADSTRTQVTYQVGGIPWEERDRLNCFESPILQLPDGQKFESFPGNGGIGMYGPPGSALSFENTVSLSPVPVGENRLYFLMPCKQISLALELIPAPAGFAISAVEVGTNIDTAVPTSTSTIMSSPTAEVETIEPAATTLAPGGMPTGTPSPAATEALTRSGLSLEKAIELSNAYILIGNFTDKGALPVTFISYTGLEDQMQITDRDGKPLACQSRPEVLTNTPEPGVIEWACEIPKPLAGPVTVRLASISVPVEETAHFTVDAQTGQNWDLNQNVELGGHSFTVDTLEKTGQGYKISFHSGPEVPDGLSFGLDITGSAGTQTEVSATSGTDNRKPDRVDYSEALTFKGAPPAGQLDLALTIYQQAPFPGPWTLTWSPPAKP